MLFPVAARPRARSCKKLISLYKFLVLMDTETAFFSGLIELQYGRDVQDQLRHLAQHVPWAQGWPANLRAFWNAEAFMWQRKIGMETRSLIEMKLQFLSGKRVLDLGCGSYSYLPCVGFDISEKMLQFNERCTEKVQGNLEVLLPFTAASFDAVSAIFVLNYVHNYVQLLSEIVRVLNTEGIFMAVLSAGAINDWQKQKEATVLAPEEWVTLFKSQGFTVDFFVQQNLWFFKCVKRLL